MPDLGLDRQVLASFLPNHQAIVAFEKMFDQVSSDLPSTIEEAQANAASAIAAARVALGALVEVSEQLALLLGAPARAPVEPTDDDKPATYLGTLATQNHDAVEITGGIAGLDAGTVTAPSLYLGGEANTGLYWLAANKIGITVNGVKLITFGSTAIQAAQPIGSSVPVGTPPFNITSTTKVVNLFADKAATLDSPTTFPANATDLPTVITLANALKAAGIAKGL